MKNSIVADKWKRQADADFKAACDSAQAGNYSWACFGAQQSAEKYLKAFLFLQGQRVLETHSLRKLVYEVAEHVSELKKLELAAKELDKVYFSSRYPDALADDIPAEYYSVEDANELLGHAKTIRDGILKQINSRS